MSTRDNRADQESENADSEFESTARRAISLAARRAAEIDAEAERFTTAGDLIRAEARKRLAASIRELVWDV